MLIVVSGPSGVGKGTIVSRVRQAKPEYELSISLTTRAPRPHEVNGEDYWFVSRREFRQRIDEAGMLEWAEFSGNLYGTPRAEVVHLLAAGKTVLLEIEVEGARQVKSAMPQALTVFIRPPSMFELAARLRGRGTEDAEEVDRRLRTAEMELAVADEFDVQLVNTDVADTTQELLQLIESAQSRRIHV